MPSHIGRRASPAIDRRTCTWIAAGALISVLMRVRMLWSPVGVDEGGYLAIARAWAHGHVLYRDVWVDRPQGLLVLFRMWDWLAGGSTWSIRLMAMAFGVVLVVATAVTVWALVGHAAARWAAVVCGVVSAAPVLEAHTANGELLSGAVAAAGLAVAAVGLSRARPLRWFVASGVLAGIALSLKQSGFDGLLAVAGWLVGAALFTRSQRRAALRRLAALSAGVAGVLSLLIVNGASTGWERWWTAVAGYRLRVENSLVGAQWANLRESYPFATAVLGGAACCALVGAVLVAVAARRRETWPHGRHALILVVWAATAAAAFVIGGGFWRHYWLLLAAPFSALAGVTLSRIGRHAPLVLACVVAPCLVVSAWVFVGNPRTINVRAFDDGRSEVNVPVARWFASHRRRGDNLYVLCFSAALYADAHQDPGYPYLWFTEVRHGPNAHRLLVDYLGDAGVAPRYIAEYQSPSTCDPSGDVGRIVRRDYHQVTVVDGIAIEQRDAPTQDPTLGNHVA